LTQAEANSIKQKVRPYARQKVPIFFTGIRYGKPVGFGSVMDFSSQSVLLVSGLANPSLLEKQVRNNYLLLHHLVYKDHHTYTIKDAVSIRQAYQKFHAQTILVSEKDYVKLQDPALAPVISTLPFFYLPIEVHFLLDGQAAFNKKVLNAIIHPQN
jgi:tetraacyldisaccharide 4'-kinase